MANKKSMEFKLFAPNAKTVYLAGDFNNWNTSNMKMKKDGKGLWKIKTDLTMGNHEYKFIVDGNWWNDPACKNWVANSVGSQNCLVKV
ncbi:MAG: isoamylase early set domain-containing protein [Candidatus Omnitrophica bacterium]|nr:isoamylase early set domain-containing protein [Candidatus Omnitrophota bacterium]MDD5236420.1 isoamylase early set domain-containing protein [Candidatus Omnitrophota bacterium]MDD5610107.1 isoamylase early set domain-containing protein [Candidatus Omnitrophota bacterium]